MPARKKLESTNIFIDTSVFIKNNFFDGKSLNLLLDQAKLGTINLYITDIVINEIKANFSAQIKKSKSEIKKARIIFNKECRVLRNVPSLSTFLNTTKIDIEELEKEFNTNLNNIIKNTPIKIIDCYKVNTEEIFKKYFNSKTPFKEGEKKSEFPDAFNLSAIEDWCIEHNKEIYILSNDNDLLKYISKGLIPIDNIDLLLNYIVRFNEEKIKETKRLAIIQDLFTYKKAKLQREIKVRFEKEVSFDTGDADLLEVHTHKVVFGDFSILEITKDEAYIKVPAEITFSVNLSYKDYSEGYYDKEEDEWHFVETKTSTIDDKRIIPIELVIEFDDDLTTEFSQIDVNSVGIDTTIDLDHEEYGHSERYK